MATVQINKISLIGTGRVASQLSRSFYRSGCDILQVYGRNGQKAAELAAACGAQSISSLADLKLNADIYIVSIADHSLEGILPEINIGNKLIVHTSGSVPMDVFSGRFTNYGVFYPVQTFSYGRDLEMKDVPVCIEANNINNEGALTFLALKISRDVQVVSTEMRLALHTAAVFASNFTNYFYAVAEEVLAENQLDFNLIRPLIMETARRVMDGNPHDVQTGPARRHDQSTIEKHMALLERNPEYRELYAKITALIKRKYKS